MSRGKPKALNSGDKALLSRAIDKRQKGENLSVSDHRILAKAAFIALRSKIEEILPYFPAEVFYDATKDSDYKVKKFIDTVGAPIPKTPGESFDLREFFRWFYQFHKEQQFIPKGGDSAVEHLDIGDKLRYEKYKRERIARLRDEKKYVPVDVVYEIMYRFATTIRVTAERLGQRYGDDVFEEMNDAIEEARETITELFYSDDGAESETVIDDTDADNE